MVSKTVNTMMDRELFRVLTVNLSEGKAQAIEYGDCTELMGGSGLAAALFDEYGLAEEGATEPEQPLVFAIGPLTGYFPLMSKAVLGFKSPYTQQYTESHAGGRLAMALRFTGYDALVITGVARAPSCLIAGARQLEVRDVHYLWGQDAFTAGKYLRRIEKAGSGHRSILRIGPAGEQQVAFASVNVDSYRQFGRLGAGAVMGAKNLKGIIVLGDKSLTLPEGKNYAELYRDVYREITESEAMRKYHDLGTPENLLLLNEMQALPWRNLQATHSNETEAISGEQFADRLLLRQIACAGCPVGCIHIGLLRESFANEHEFLYRQVSYDYEPIFAAGAMLGMTQPEAVLSLLEEIDSQGLDAISTGVALAWATEAFERGIITERESLSHLQFGQLNRYRDAVHHLAMRSNEFYQLLGEGTKAAAARYGGEEFACVLGQEMAGYATGEVYFVSQAYGFRHSHLDSAGYSYDEKAVEKDVDNAVHFLVDEERRRIQLTCMVSCLFARGVYTEERLREALESIGMKHLAENLSERTTAVQSKRWKLKGKTGYETSQITIPRRLRNICTAKGGLDETFMERVIEAYRKAIGSLMS
jgi:aldehyde:ferredoxin oxidoreductase